MSEILFSKEQAMMADIASKFFRDRWPIESVRAQIEEQSSYDAELWAEMVDAGWLGLVVPEEHGGTGLGATDLVSVVEPMGRRLVASPFLSTQLVIQALLATGDDDGARALREKWLPRLAEGAVGAVALVEPDGSWDLESPTARVEDAGASSTLSGTKTFVTDGDVADVILVSARLEGGPALAFVDAASLPDEALAREVVVDETRRSFRLVLDGIEVDDEAVVAGTAAVAALRAVRNMALLLVAAEATGGTAGALDVIVEYLGSRRQFDRLIGSYQALKHPTVDILCGLERARSHLYHAATVFEQSSSEVALRMAKAASSDTFAFAGDRAVQFHGGFGFTYECDAQLFLRRALWCQYQYGDAVHHRRHLAELLLRAS
jgi:alkylation response protein AidB-like acyl-CoA dehydrogenase